VASWTSVKLSFRGELGWGWLRSKESRAAPTIFASPSGLCSAFKGRWKPPGQSSSNGMKRMGLAFAFEIRRVDELGSGGRAARKAHRANWPRRPPEWGWDRAHKAMGTAHPFVQPASTPPFRAARALPSIAWRFGLRNGASARTDLGEHEWLGGNSTSGFPHPTITDVSSYNRDLRNLRDKRNRGLGGRYGRDSSSQAGRMNRAQRALAHCRHNASWCDTSAKDRHRRLGRPTQR
jgi:hypothetical protein